MDAPGNGKNVVSLREYIEEKFMAAEKANTLFMDRLDDRLEGMNQFREELRTQASQFMTRKEWELAHARVLEDIRFLREAKAGMEGKASQLSVNITFLVSLIGLAVAVAGLLMRV
jgi:hypothetical protein